MYTSLFTYGKIRISNFITVAPSRIRAQLAAVLVARRRAVAEAGNEAVENVAGHSQPTAAIGAAVGSSEMLVLVLEVVVVD